MSIETVKQPADTSDASPDALQQEARVWVRLLTSGEVKPWDAQGFQRWLRISPAHKDAFNEARRVWQAMKPAAGAVLHHNPDIASVHARALHRAPVPRRAFMGAAVGAAAVAAIAVVRPPLGLWPSAAELGADYRTATGEQQRIAQAGSAKVTLNTRTSARRQLVDGQMVGLELIHGQAAVELGGSGQRFSLLAGVGRSEAEAGRFDVKYLNGRVCVTCLDGAVHVTHPAGARALQARQQTVYDASAISGIASAEPLDVEAWRKGELVFRQTRLVDVIEEINRYRSGRVMLANEAVRDRPVSGRFQIASLDTALWQLQHTYKLDARSLPGGLLVLS
ncbi:FecR family protein [Variovorax boronicumulans]